MRLRIVLLLRGVAGFKRGEKGGSIVNTIRNSDLECLVKRINKLTKNAESPYSGGKANIGNYHLSGAYGGVSLHQMSNESGGVSDVFRCGHIPKRDLYERMRAFVDGIETHATEVAR